MKSFFKTIAFSASLIFSICLFTSCMDVDDTLGKGLLPDDMDMVFRMDVVDGVDSYLMSSDSISTKRLNRLMIGNMESDRFGRVTVGGLLQYVPSTGTGRQTNPYGYKAHADSIELVLTISNIYGDNSVEQKFYVYNFEPVEGQELSREDNVYYYSNYDIESSIDRSAPLFSFTMQDESTGSAFKMLEIEPAGEAFLQALVRQDTMLYQQNDDAFREIYKGFYIAPSADPAEAPLNAAVYEMNPLSTTSAYYPYYPEDQTFLIVYSHNHVEGATDLTGGHTHDGETLVTQDTTYVAYSFDDRYIENYTALPSVSVMTVKHDYTGSLVDESLYIDPNDFDPATAQPQSTFFVQGMLGVAGYLYFNDDFMTQLRDLCYFDPVNKTGAATMMVNKAMLYIYLDDQDDNVEILDTSVDRLGMYYFYRNNMVSPIPDYYYTYEETTELPYGGLLRRDQARYEMNISGYIMELLTEPQTPRGIRLSPAIMSFFKPRASVLRNGPYTDPQDPDYQYRIRVELSYTLIKN